MADDAQSWATRIYQKFGFDPATCQNPAEFSKSLSAAAKALKGSGTQVDVLRSFYGVDSKYDERKITAALWAKLHDGSDDDSMDSTEAEDTMPTRVDVPGPSTSSAYAMLVGHANALDATLAACEAAAKRAASEGDKASVDRELKFVSDGLTSLRELNAYAVKTSMSEHECRAWNASFVAVSSRCAGLQSECTVLLINGERARAERRHAEILAAKHAEHRIRIGTMSSEPQSAPSDWCNLFRVNLPASP